jgi:two-component system, NtrC family, sensor kinase
MPMSEGYSCASPEGLAAPSLGVQAAPSNDVLASMTSLPMVFPDLFAVIEQPNYLVEYVNPAGRTLLGLQEGDSMEDRSLMEFIPGDGLWTLLNDAIPTAWRAGSWTGELFVRRSDGVEIPVTAVMIARPAHQTGRGHDCLWVMARDATEVRTTIAGLRRDQRYLRVLLENIPDCIYFKDVNSRFERVSHAMALRFGVTDPKKLVGKTDFDVFTDEHARPAYEAEQQIMRTERPLLDLEEKETFTDGRVTWCSTTKLPLYNEYGQIIGTFGVSRDITGRKRTEAALAQAQRNLIEASRLAGMAEVASGVLHNIGNAFNSVNTSVALISDHTAALKVGNLARAVALIQENSADLGKFFTEDSRGKQLPAYLAQLSAQLTREHQTLLNEMQSLCRGVDHIKSIIAMQQNFTRASSLMENLSASELVIEAARIAEASISRHKIELVQDFQAAPQIRGVRHRVLEILVNLITNAKHALSDGTLPERRITLSVKPVSAERVQISVKDTGVGIKPENLQRIFSFGFTTRRDGHGFGLHSSAVAAQDMNGSLTARSEGIGRGAEFVLELPAVPPDNA